MQKIAFWRTVGDAYGFLFDNLRRFFNLAAVWLAGVLVLGAAALGLFPAAPALGAVIAVAALIFYAAAVVAFSVAWHRAILRGEPSPSPAGLHFGRREWRFFGYGLLITLIIGVALAVAVGVLAVFAIAMMATLGSMGIIFFALPALAAIAGWAFCSRLMLALPAVAVDEESDLLSTAWARGRGNSVRLFFGPILCALPLVIAQAVLRAVIHVAFGLQYWASAPHHKLALLAAAPLAQGLLTALSVVVYFLQLGLTVGFLSFAYRQLNNRAAPASGLPLAMPAE
jgi:hypothetical protein